MGLLQDILKSKEEDVDFIVKNAIEKCNLEAKSVTALGNVSKTQSKLSEPHKGFIPFNTKIDMGIEMTYDLNTTDFIYEFAHYVREKNVSNILELIMGLENFMNDYLGMPNDNNDPYDIFNESNVNISHFKNKNVSAQCTVRGAMAQQILSVFGMECYYCMGCVQENNNTETHCFNIVKRKNDYALLDYSMPVEIYDEQGKCITGYMPFIATFSNEEFLDFINNQSIKSFQKYWYEGSKRYSRGEKRKYVVNARTIEEHINDNQQMLNC